MRIRKPVAAVALLLFGAAGCLDLDVVNPNAPDTAEVLASPEDTESVIGGSFKMAWDGVGGYIVDPPFLSASMKTNFSTMSFEHSSTAANFGQVPYSTLPRAPINNSPADAYYLQHSHSWNQLYAAANQVANALRQLDAGMLIGTGDAAVVRTARARAFAKFVQGYAHGYVALMYDQGVIFDEHTDPHGEIPFVSYQEVMARALQSLEEAVAAIGDHSFTIGQDAQTEGWLSPNQVLTADQFRRLNYSLMARFRAEVARSPTERENVDWARVIADVDRGLEQPFMIHSDAVGWRWTTLHYLRFFGAWGQVNYFILGMADQSGGYQAWRSIFPHDEKGAEGNIFRIVTPDRRFPQGATRSEQEANPGHYIVYKHETGWTRPDRGRWRWSYYQDSRHAAWNTTTIGALPHITMAEMRLLKAEGLLRRGQPGAAADLINVTRVGTGGLQPVSAASNPDCVPRLYDGSCGDLMEALKWEKRLETYQTRMGSWFFDMRGWGDHAEGTPLHLPIPARELMLRQLPIYTFGGTIGTVWQDISGQDNTYQIGPDRG